MLLRRRLSVAVVLLCLTAHHVFVFSAPTWDDREDEEVECSSAPDLSLLRNGLGDNSYFVWPDGRIPYDIGQGFNASHEDNIREAVDEFNVLFAECVQWVPKTNEYSYVSFESSGVCESRVGRALWPLPVAQSIYLGKCAHLVGHVKHEMLHAMGFYHEHSRADRDAFVEIRWHNVRDDMHSQFETYRWTTAYGEDYDYSSILHYSARAFSKHPADPSVMTIVPKRSNVTDTDIGVKRNLSAIDINKVKKMYKCPPYRDWRNTCSSDSECGLDEYCTYYVLGGQCHTQLPDGAYCTRSEQCAHAHCSMGRCSRKDQYCAYKYVPLVQNECTSYCGSVCLLSSQCGGSCATCRWNFACS